MLAIVLIPSAALLVTGVSVAGYLVSEGLSARDFSSYFAQSSQSLLQSTTALANERTLSLRALAGDRQAQAALHAQWQATDTALSQSGRAANVEQGLNPQALANSTAALQELVSEMAVVRQGVAAGRESATAVDDFYTRFTNGVAPVFLRTALSAPRAPSVPGFGCQS